MIGLKNLVEKNFRDFGVNKKGEITRLLFEISKRDKIPYHTILSDLPESKNNYHTVKNQLVKKRFPYSFLQNVPLRPYLPRLGIKPENKVEFNKAGFNLKPKNIYIEEKVYNCHMANRFKALFPKSNFIRIESLKSYIKEKKYFGVWDYNSRCENIFIVKEKFDFFKKCPCTKSAASCGYHVFNLGFGCPYECTYCYLQEYTNCPGIVLPSNVEDFFGEFKRCQRPGVRIGTGEFTDSLVFDDITNYSISLVEFFNKNPGTIFEFKTKSGNIDNLLAARHKENTVISWSLNPPKVIKENEFYAASLEKRIDSAVKCVRAGYKVGLHFDPVIHYKGWDKDYHDLVNLIFDKISCKSIAWISLGTLRFNPRLKTIIENRFPKNKILDEELLIGFDGKLRYPDTMRFFMYKNMISWIRKRDRNVYIYLCMENLKKTKYCNI